jgi:hypothetical protein
MTNPNAKRHVMTLADVRRGLARQFILTKVDMVNPENDRYKYIARFGEIPNCKEQEFWLNKAELESMIIRKKQQGYHLVDFDKVFPEGAGQEEDVEEYNVPTPIRDLMQQILGASQTNIARRLTENVELISMASAVEATEVLKEIGKLTPFAPGRIELIQKYFTLLPIRPNPNHRTLMAIESAFDVNEQAQRVDQIKALISNARNNVARDLIGASYRSLGTDIRWIDPLSEEFDGLAKEVKRSACKLERAFAIKIPHERERYSAEALRCMGKEVKTLYHGTYTHFVHSILKSGLIILPAPVNGSRLGRGLYFAEDARRSLGYVTQGDNLMFMASVIVGEEKVDGGSTQYSAPPPGFDSVRGTMSYSGMDEIVVYREDRATLRYLVSVQRS